MGLTRRGEYVDYSSYCKKPSTKPPKYCVFYDEDGRLIENKLGEIVYARLETSSIHVYPTLHMECVEIEQPTMLASLFGASRRIMTEDIKRVIFSGPATIIMWKNGKKTVVKAQNNEAVDEEKGIALAIAKYALGNKGNYYNTIRKAFKMAERQPEGEKK